MSPRDPDSIESRRSSASQRKLTLGRRLYFALGMPVMRGLIRLLTATYRYIPGPGADQVDAIVQSDTPVAPCYWHQHHVLCSTTIRGWIRRGFKACFLVSGSVDGDVPERIARAWGAEVIRGSANQSGTLAMRDMQQMMRRGFSIVTTADGPRGPQYEFKAGAVMMARIGGTPIVPLSAAADRAWYLRRWDRFMIPKPFARVAVGVGAPIEIGRDVALDDIEEKRRAVQEAVMSLMAECESCLSKSD
ncbi:MAG: lysophospholipid acyltransferase family protein [Pseudomonadota bacterium]